MHIKTTPGSIDGIRVSAYVAGETYDLGGSQGERELALAFLGARLAEEVKAEPAPANKAIESAPENKSFPGRKSRR